MLGVQVIAMLAVVALVCCGVAALVAGHRRAQAAADLGALAGATAVQQGDDACSAATRVVGRNRARLHGCVVEGRTVRVEVLLSGPTLLGRVRLLGATARAGPTTGLG